MKQVKSDYGGRTTSLEFQVKRNTMVKPVIVGEKDGFYEAANGKLFVKERYDYLFTTKKGKVLKRHQVKENADKTKEWMK